MNRTNVIQYILCVDIPEAAFLRLRNEGWTQTGLTRWSRIKSRPIDAMLRSAADASHLLLFVDPNVNTSDVWAHIANAGLAARSQVVSTLPTSVRARRTYTGAIPRTAGIETLLPSLLPTLARPTIEWRGNDDATHTAEEQFPSSYLQLVLEKFFPGWTGTASFDTVEGGRSGAPLIQLFRYDQPGEYYLKFFKSSAAFISEWNGHRQAMQWLGEYSVNLNPIIHLGETGELQAEAFPAPPLVICFQAASVLTRLKDLYVLRDARFLLQAYRIIIDTLSRNQPSTVRHVVLSTVPDIGPVGEEGRATSLIGSLRSPSQRKAIFAALEALRPYAISEFLDESTWQAVAGQIRAFLLDWEPAALHTPCPLSLGHMHGDANSRNFLFHGNDPHTARGLQIVDVGGYHADASRLFDLAQLEADLKFVLMATELSCGGYLDIDTRRLSYWRQEEERAVSEGFRYVCHGNPEHTEIERAYKIVESIRERANSLSSGDPNGLGYLFFLLYWTLRKTRHIGVLPETKRLLAFYSSYLLLLKINSLQRP